MGAAMKLRKVRLENIRSFLEPEELLIDGDISILIGPNGGGKTNLIDATITTIRRHLLTSWAWRRSPTAEFPTREELVPNDMFNSAVLERHTQAGERRQIVEIEVKVTSQDVSNIKVIKESAAALADFAENKYVGYQIKPAANWNHETLSSGQRLTYRTVNNVLDQPQADAALYKEYLQLYEADSRLRSEAGMGALSTPMLSLPVNRTAGGMQASLSLANFNEYDYKRPVDASTSRSAGQIFTMALGRIAEKYRLLLEQDRGDAKARFYNDPQMKSLSMVLESLGYKWELVSVNPLTNQYDIRLIKQDISFLIGAASSGERELLTYLFAVYGLNVRDALIFVDEPEMHLHPKWQQTLLTVFERLAEETGNQFVLATHSPIFVSPASIQYVSRIFSEKQQSKIIRLNSAGLPESKHLFAIVNSQNNERIFFADKVVLVEGISDRLFFDAVFKKLEINVGPAPVFEIVDVGGKGFFKPYLLLLEACHVPYAIIADRDYVSDIGPPKLKELFVVDGKKILDDVIRNPASRDGESLVLRFDEAISSGNVADLQGLWDYIKSHRRRLKATLDESEQRVLSEFITEQQRCNVFILAKGDLETYLPEGHRTKDVDKLIRFLSGNFWDALPFFAQEELCEIAKLIASS
jgi:putative ATP-dependent endonuclease of OLD family